MDAADQKAERRSRKRERKRKGGGDGLSENNPWKRRGRGACERWHNVASNFGMEDGKYDTIRRGWEHVGERGREGGRPEEPQEEYFTFYGAGVVGVAPDKKSVSPPAKSERECIKLRITTNRTLTAHAYYNGTPC